jgi:hypothetical protein
MKPRQVVAGVMDGDTVIIDGEPVRLLGVNAPEIGEPGYMESKVFLDTMVKGKKVWIEQDRYPEDRWERKLVWIWLNCESIPTFKDIFYMIKTDGSHNPPLAENPVGCRQGKLVNEEILKAKMGELFFLSQKGELKYEERLKEVVFKKAK